MGIPLGSPVPNLSWLLRDEDGELANATLVQLLIEKPDGITTSATVAHPGVGTYTANYTPLIPGRFSFRWKASGTITQTYSDSFYVEDTDARSLVSVDEAMRHLKLAGVLTDTTTIEHVRWFAEAATSACESYCRRPLVRRTYTESYNGGASYVALRNAPVLAIEAVTENGVELDDTDYLFESTGMVYRGTATAARAWYTGRQMVAITYQAGFAEPPADLRLAVLREIEHLWQRSQNSSHPGLGDEGLDEMMRDFTGSAMPGAVRYLLDPYVSVGGFA